MENIIEQKAFRKNNQHILTHWQDSVEIIRVLEGKIYCMINGKEYILQKDDICVINSQQLHRMYGEQNIDGKTQQIELNLSELFPQSIIFRKYMEPILKEPSFSHLISTSGHPYLRDICNLMDEIEETEQKKPDTWEITVLTSMLTIVQKLYLICRETKFGKPAVRYADMMIYRDMVNYIYGNFSEKITLDDIADAGNVSRSKCCHIFKKYAQYSPIDYLNSYRLQVSTDMLKNSDETIAAISLNCGFLQQSYYNRLFIREYGITPTEYRRRAHMS